MNLDEFISRFVGEKEAALLHPSASQIAAATKDYGYMEVYAYPSVDSVLAAAILASTFARNNVGFTLYFTAAPPAASDAPMLLLGYPSSLASELSPRKPSALIGFGEVPQGLLSVAVTSHTSSSIAGLLVGVLSEITVVGPPAVYSVVAGYWRGLDVGKKGEFTGIENGIIETLKLENRVEEHFSLRLFRWLFEPTEEALHLTLEPYLPGITGRPEEARRLLEEDPRLSPLIGKTLEEAPEQAVATLGEKLYVMLKEASSVPRRPSELIGITHYSRPAPLQDLREAAIALAVYGEKHGAAALASLGVAEDLVAAAAYYTYHESIPSIVDAVEANLSRKRPPLKRSGPFTVALLERVGDAPLLPVERILRKLGVIRGQEVAGYQLDGSTALVSMESLLYSQGLGAVREAIDSKCLRYREGELLGEIRLGCQ